MYEVGQKVRCIDVPDGYAIKNGEVYTVGEIRDGELSVYIKEVEQPYKPHRFEPAGPKFQKGETVRVVGDSNYHNHKGGHIGILTALIGESLKDDKGQEYSLWRVDDKTMGVRDYDLELVEDTDKIEIKKEDVMGDAREMTRDEKADAKDEKVQELEEQIVILKADSKNLRKYKTDRDETIAQIMSKHDCKKDKAEDILALHEKGIK